MSRAASTGSRRRSLRWWSRAVPGEVSFSTGSRRRSLRRCAGGPRAVPGEVSFSGSRKRSPRWWSRADPGVSFQATKYIFVPTYLHIFVPLSYEQEYISANSIHIRQLSKDFPQFRQRCDEISAEKLECSSTFRKRLQSSGKFTLSLRDDGAKKCYFFQCANSVEPKNK